MVISVPIQKVNDICIMVDSMCIELESANVSFQDIEKL